MLTQNRTREGGVLIESGVGEVYRFADGLWGIRRPAWNDTDARRRPPAWYRLKKSEKRRLRKQRRLAQAGRPVTLRDLAGTEGLMLFRAATRNLPDAVLFESISSQHHCCDTRWVGTCGWKAIRRALWGKSFPEKKHPEAEGCQRSPHDVQRAGAVRKVGGLGRQPRDRGRRGPGDESPVDHLGRQGRGDRPLGKRALAGSQETFCRLRAARERRCGDRGGDPSAPRANRTPEGGEAETNL